MPQKRIIVIGAGGLAREVVWLLGEINRRSPSYDFVGFVVSDPSRLGEHDSKDLVRGDFAWLRENRHEFDALALGIGSPTIRIRIADELKEFGPDYWPPLIHPGVLMEEKSCTVGHGAIVCAAVIATVNVRIEPFALVNLACTLGHECTIGRGASLNPTVNVSGGVSIGEGVLIGTGAQLLQYIAIEPGATVGAGAVVTHSVPAGVTVVGIPAKPLIR